MKWLYGTLIAIALIELVGGYNIECVLLLTIALMIFIVRLIIKIIKNKKIHLVKKEKNIIPKDEEEQLDEYQRQMILKSIENYVEEIKLRDSQKQTYHAKDMLTECEKQFLTRLNNIFKDKYIIQPQIPLRMIIDKDGNSFAGELNRYIDFGIFDHNYKLLVLIELNDKSHKTKERYERDLKVQDICKQANIPLITFWTYGNQTDENIRYIIEKEINYAR